MTGLSNVAGGVMNVVGYPINQAIKGADWALNKIPGRQQLVQRFGPQGPQGMFQARGNIGVAPVNVAQSLAPESDHS